MSAAPWILHLSDPHLGDVSPGQGLDDDKVGWEAQEDLETTQRLFKRTLGTLGSYVEAHGKPAAVAVSGDLTYRARPSGFEAFGGLLAEHQGLLPTDLASIVVVPGNHDVVWDEEPGSSARYAGFVAATRDHGCATPLLDGIDFDPASGVLDATARNYPHLVEHDDFVIVPVNSSNYCGVLTDVRGGYSLADWTMALAPLDDAERERALAELKRLRQQDMARVSRPQIEALVEYLGQAGIERDRAGDPRVRIAVIHHQLLPVTTREERKPFESLVNLGLVRQTLREFEFDVVLHGHKHESGVLWDVVGLAGAPVSDPPRRMLIVASPGQFQTNEPTMRALALTGPRSARNLRITTFGGSGPQRKHAAVLSEEAAPLWLAGMETAGAERTVVHGSTAHETYARLRGLFDLSGGAEVRNLVCRVDEGADALMLPPDYPDVGFGDRQAWFDGLVDWWQRSRSELVDLGVLPFNHGGRIYRRWGDQVERAVRVLDQRKETSRALIALVAPRETGRYEHDDRDIRRGTYPALVLAELSLAERDGGTQLDCFGYFRKQEMQYWWPVNLAELRQLQERVSGNLSTPAAPGRLVTFAAVGLWKEALPEVAVPEIDRLVEEAGPLWSMAGALAFAGARTEAALTDWARVLTDLEGMGRSEPPRPRAGHLRLLAEVERFANLADAGTIEPARAALQALCDRYVALEDAENLNAEARKLIRDAVRDVRAAVQSILGELGAGPEREDVRPGA